jgi:hypothetical protein
MSSSESESKSPPALQRKEDLVGQLGEAHRLAEQLGTLVHTLGVVSAVVVGVPVDLSLLLERLGLKVKAAGYELGGIRWRLMEPGASRPPQPELRVEAVADEPLAGDAGPPCRTCGRSTAFQVTKHRGTWLACVECGSPVADCECKDLARGPDVAAEAPIAPAAAQEPSGDMFSLMVVVQGEEVEVTNSPRVPLIVFGMDALKRAGHGDMPLPGWRFQREDGRELAMDALPTRAGLASGDQVCLVPAGASAGLAVENAELASVDDFDADFEEVTPRCRCGRVLLLRNVGTGTRRGRGCSPGSRAPV